MLGRESRVCTASQGLLSAVCEVIARIQLLSKKQLGCTEVKTPWSVLMSFPGGGGVRSEMVGELRAASDSGRRKAYTQSGLQLVYCNRKSTQTTEKEFHQKQLATLSLRQYTFIKMRHPEIWERH